MEITSIPAFDLISIIETGVLLLTALYIGKLLFLDGGFLERHLCAENSKFKQSIQLLFEVGAFISMPKSSLQHQRVLR